MKTRLLAASIAGLLCTATSCVKEYECHCTYVADADPITGIAAPNKEEHTEIEGRTVEYAQTLCMSKEDKYWDQNYSGTCTAER